MITDRTDNENLRQILFGPSITVDQNIPNQYKKNSPSSKSFSGSELSYKDNSSVINTKKRESNDSRLHQVVLKAKQGFRNRLDGQSNFFKVSKRLLNDQKVQKPEQHTFMKALNQNFLVHKFKDNLFTSAYVLAENQKNILENESYLQEKKENLPTLAVLELNKKKGRGEKLTKLLMPGAKLTMIWDLISLLIHLFSLWICPMIASFAQDIHILKGSELFINTYGIVEAILTLHRPIIIQGEIISEIQQIWNLYVTNQLLEDFLSVSIWFMIFFDLNHYVVLNESMAIILIIITIRKIARKYNSQIEYLYLQGFNSNLLDIITLFFLICYFAHMMACLWFYIGYATTCYGSWLTFYNIIDESIWVKYNYSYYWATLTMVTVGYGDITAKNQVEVAFVSIMVLISSCMFAYSMNSIGVIVKSIYDQQTKFKRTLILMNQFMRKSQVDPSIQNRVKNYIRFSIENEILENNDDTIKIINDLPAGLKIELEQNIKNNIIQRIKLFMDHFSQQTQHQVSQNLTLVKFTPKDIIYHRDERKDKNLYFIAEGEVQIIEEKSKKILKNLKAGDTFGEYQFFTGQNTKESTISVGFTELYKIDREKFLGYIKQNQKDHERFHRIKDVILYQKTYSIFLYKCPFCTKFSHIPIECPLLTYQPNLFIKICKSNKQDNKRATLLRSGEKVKSILLQPQVQQSATEYQENMSNFDSINNIEKSMSNQISEQYSAQIVSQNENQIKSFPTDIIAKTLHIESSQRSKGDIQQVYRDDRNEKKASIFIQKSKNTILYNEGEKVTSKGIQPSRERKQLDQFISKFSSLELEGFERMQSYVDYLPKHNAINVIKNANRDKPKLRAIIKITKGRSFALSFRAQKNQ